LTELVLFHHAHGLTDGVRAFGEELRAAGHVVHVPDLFARELDATVAGAELFVYPGDRHVFTDAIVPGYDAAAATLVAQRVLAFLDRAG
jgi:dienelactone hydrolase